jgi:ubiquinone biosynthesis protein
MRLLPETAKTEANVLTEPTVVVARARDNLASISAPESRDKFAACAQETLSDFYGLVTSMPRDLARLIKDARHGRMRVDLDFRRLDSFGLRLHRAINRATIGIMTASLVVGFSIVMTMAEGPTLFGVPLLTLFGLLGYLITFVNSLWIILSIWRSSRR